MRILHLADLHLGKLVHETSMTDDQAHVLDQIAAIAREGKAEAVVICGDAYDRPIPPVAATRLMDDFLSRLVLDLGLPVLVIPGNHDSAERLGFGGRLLRERGLHLAPALPGAIVPVTLADAHGPVTFFPLPYVSPVMLKEREDDLPSGDFDAALARVMDALPEAEGRSVCLSHCFTMGGGGCDSERPLSIGGADKVGRERFDRFDLTLLGHLHRPQRVGEKAFYAGSPLKYSFSEADHVKSVALFDLAADGTFTREEIPLTPRRDMRRLRGSLAEILTGAAVDPARADYLEITLTDEGALFDYAAKLREAYPNVLNITREAWRATGEGRIEVRGKTEWEIAQAFFRQVGGRDLEPAEAAALRAVVDEMLRVDAAGAAGEGVAAGENIAGGEGREARP